MRMKMIFLVLEIWLFGFLKSFGNFSKRVCTDPECWFLEEVDAVLEKYQVDYDGTEQIVVGGKGIRGRDSD